MDNQNNSTLKALIIDDEMSGRTMIEYYLKEFAGDMFHEMVLVSSLREAITSMKTFQPDVIFTDYELRNETGIMIQSHLTKDIPVVIVSAHSQYALEAIQTNVFDYLLKPLSESEVLRFKGRLKKRFTREILSGTQLNFEEHLIIKDAGENIIVAHQDILFIEAAGAYSKIVTEAKNFIASKTLKSIETKLPASFIRIHRSFIVPLNQIASYSSSIVCLKNGQQIALSKTGKKLLHSFI